MSGAVEWDAPDLRLDQSNAEIPVDGDGLAARGAEFVHETWDAHVSPAQFRIWREVPERVVKDHHAEWADQRREEIPVGLDALIAVVAVDEEQIDGLRDAH